MPPYIGQAIEQLHINGFEAYIVGGCVRDALLGAAPKDWDITTNAVPDEINDVFSDRKRLSHGEKYGTVTVLFGDAPVEITAYRNDGAYTDNRRPDSVSFTRSLREDLSRRDFTINALAYGHDIDVIDFFGGVGDIRDKIIRCVGDAGERFREDALRILRALRFSARLGFAVEAETASSIHNLCCGLKNISFERVCAELSGILTGGGESVAAVFTDFTDVLFVPVPELNRRLPEWENIVRSIRCSPPDLTLRLILLLRGVDGARIILRRLRFKNEIVNDAAETLAFIDACAPSGAAAVKRMLNKSGERRLRLYLSARRAIESSSGADETIAKLRLEAINAAERLTDDIIIANDCYSLKDLKIDGDDLLEMGYMSGKPLGIILDALLGQVIDGALPNERPVLMEYAKRARVNFAPQSTGSTLA